MGANEELRAANAIRQNPCLPFLAQTGHAGQHHARPGRPRRVPRSHPRSHRLERASRGRVCLRASGPHTPRTMEAPGLRAELLLKSKATVNKSESNAERTLTITPGLSSMKAIIAICLNLDHNQRVALVLIPPALMGSIITWNASETYKSLRGKRWTT